MARPIAILSHVVVDEIVGLSPDRVVPEVGGAGAYAAVGASLTGTPGETVIVSGVGTEDRAALTDWFVEREIDPTGLFTVGEHSPRTRIRYFADGERIETSLFGLDHFAAHTPLPEHIPYPPADLAGAYLFHDHGDEYWRRVDGFRADFHGPLLWEISSDSCRRELWPVVRERLSRVDVFSMNRAEALRLFGTRDLGRAIESLRIKGVTSILRCGASGSLIVEGARLAEIGVSPVDATDPTGGGNSYSGAFLSAFAATGDPIRAARLAAAAAGIVVSQHGAPPIDSVLRERVADSALRISVTPR